MEQATKQERVVWLVEERDGNDERVAFKGYIFFEDMPEEARKSGKGVYQAVVTPLVKRSGTATC